MPQLSTKKLLTAYAIGDAGSKDVIDWATMLLTTGSDSPHLRVLAGYNEAQAEADLEEFRVDFRKTLAELGLELPPERTAYEDYACFICGAIIDGTISDRKGHRTLYSIWQEVNYGIGGAHLFEPFMYLDDSLSLVEEGYPPLMERFAGLNQETYPDILRNEARLFIDAHYQRRQNKT